ncbi:MAG: hypothetical protein EWM72_00389 [Nitrospira sp.]|nr:MAG: hypothetical protein EWM72_00389 [Nitrospira sp.]
MKTKNRQNLIAAVLAGLLNVCRKDESLPIG